MLPEKLNDDCWLVGLSDGYPHVATLAQLMLKNKHHEIVVYTASAGLSDSRFLEIGQVLYSFEFWSVAPSAILAEFCEDFVKIPDPTKLYALGYLYGGTFPDRAPLIAIPKEVH